jgi:hypothetical protein
MPVRQARASKASKCSGLETGGISGTWNKREKCTLMAAKRTPEHDGRVDMICKEFYSWGVIVQMHKCGRGEVWGYRANA